MRDPACTGFGVDVGSGAQDDEEAGGEAGGVEGGEGAEGGEVDGGVVRVCIPCKTSIIEAGRGGGRGLEETPVRVERDGVEACGAEFLEDVGPERGYGQAEGVQLAGAGGWRWRGGGGTGGGEGKGRG